MDFWERARVFAAQKSQELTQGLNLSDVVSEASKRSKELAAEASKKSKELAGEALKRADQITAQMIPPATSLNVLTNLIEISGSNEDLEMNHHQLLLFGVTDELREFVKGITTNTFRDFPIQDDSEMSDIPTVSNVRQDLTEWQERHAKIVLSTVKEISKLRYQLCPRVMKERKFWRIYFILVNSHVKPYEERYMQDVKLKATEKVKDTEKDISLGETSSKTPDEISKHTKNDVKPAASEQDLDAFLLGDLEDSDDGRDDGDDGFDDDFDKI